MSSVSVVIPLHNAETWIESTLDSVLRQTRSDELEILVIDDASRDSGAEIARKCLRDHPRARVISHERNRGVSAARNTGWKLASGDWVQFLDADDVLAPDKLQIQESAASRFPEDVAVVYSNWRRYRQIGGHWQPDGPTVESFVDDEPVLRILQQFEFGYVGPCLIRRSALVGVDGFDERASLGEDIDLMLRLAMSGATFRQIASSGQPLFFYRERPNSLWRRAALDPETVWGLLESFRRCDLFLRYQQGGCLSGEARIAVASRYAVWLDALSEQRPRFVQQVLGWIDELDLTSPPPGTRRNLRVLARLVGYPSALRVRSKVRRFRSAIARPRLSAAS